MIFFRLFPMISILLEQISRGESICEAGNKILFAFSLSLEASDCFIKCFGCVTESE